MGVFRRKEPPKRGHPPRAIRTLYPEYFLEILSAAQVPATPVNVARLTERKAFTLGTQAGAYCAQLGDQRAFRAFVNDFAGRLRDTPDVVDRMIDWLWSWHPGCHRAMTAFFDKWRNGLLKQEGSFLTGVQEIPPFDDNTYSASEDEKSWRMVYESNLK